MKNLWSLQVGEAIVAHELATLSKDFNKKFQVFIPLNSQLEDVDLILQNMKTGKSVHIQVKSSVVHAYADYRSWIQLIKKKIKSPRFKVDYFVFLLHDLQLVDKKPDFKNHFIVISPTDLLSFSKHKKVKNGRIDFNFRVRGKKVFDERDKKVYQIEDKKIKEATEYTEFLNNFKPLFKK